MALIKCPECGKDISDKAPACIHCGYPLSELLSANTSTIKKKTSILVLIEISRWNRDFAPMALQACTGLDEDLAYKLCSQQNVVIPIRASKQRLLVIKNNLECEASHD